MVARLQRLAEAWAEDGTAAAADGEEAGEEDDGVGDGEGEAGEAGAVAGHTFAAGPTPAPGVTRAYWSAGGVIVFEHRTHR